MNVLSVVGHCEVLVDGVGLVLLWSISVVDEQLDSPEGDSLSERDDEK